MWKQFFKTVLKQEGITDADIQRIIEDKNRRRLVANAIKQAANPDITFAQDPPVFIDFADLKNRLKKIQRQIHDGGRLGTLRLLSHDYGVCESNLIVAIAKEMRRYKIGVSIASMSKYIGMQETALRTHMSKCPAIHQAMHTAMELE